MRLPRLHKYFATNLEHERQCGNYESALRMARLYVRLRPSSPDAWALFASVKRNVDPPSDVQRTLERALERTGGSPRIRYELVRTLLAQNKLNNAIDTVSAATENSAWIELAHAAIARHMSAWDNLERHVNLAIKRAEQRELGSVLARGGLVLLTAPRHDDQAIMLLSRAIELEEHWFVRVVLGNLLLERDPGASREHLARARTIWAGPSHAFDEIVAKSRDSLSAEY